MTDILDFFLLFGSGLWLLYGIGLLIDKNRKGKDSVVLCMLAFITSLFLWFFLKNIFYWLPHLDGLSLPTLFLFGPYSTRILSQITNNKFKPSFSIWLYLPTILSFLLLLPYYLKSAEYKRNVDELLVKGFELIELAEFEALILYIIFIVAIIHLLFYIILFIVRSRQVWKWKNLSESSIILNVFCILIIALIGTIFVIYGQIVLDKSSLRVGGVCLTAVIIWLFLLERRFPWPLKAVQVEVKKYYKNTNLKAHLIQTIERDLFHLIEKQAIHHDFDLNREALSVKLNISVHQLSQYLNLELKTNFYEFLNNVRLKEAAELLRKNIDLSVLNIAYAVGFNSKSTFYNSFKRKYKVSPLEFRNLKGNEKINENE